MFCCLRLNDCFSVCNSIFKAPLFAVFKGFLALKTPSCVTDGLL